MKLKKIRFILLMVLINSCNSDSIETINPELHVAIPSPYLEEVLIEKGIDSDGEINQKVLKADIENIEELAIHIKSNNFKRLYNGDTCPENRYDYDLSTKNIISGIENFYELKKIVFTIESCWNSNIVNTSFNNLDKLEELYINNYYSINNRLTIENCPMLLKIGTAKNPDLGQQEVIKIEDYYQMDESNFNLPGTAHYEYDLILDDGWHLVRGKINLINLPSLELISFLEPSGGIQIHNTNTANLKKIIFRTSNKLFWNSNGSSSVPSLPLGIEEFYYATDNYEPFSDDTYLLDLNSFTDLKKVAIVWRRGWTIIDDPQPRISIKNGANLDNDLIFSLELPEFILLNGSNGGEHFELCFDDNISSEFLTNNVKVIMSDGIFNGSHIDSDCN